MKSLAAFKKVYNSLLKPIPTTDMHNGKRVYLVHTKQIARDPFGRYKNYRRQGNPTPKHAVGIRGYTNNPENTHGIWGAYDNVRQMRLLIRHGKGHQLPPVSLEMSQSEAPNARPFELYNGHHRLTAHQAEGKKLIRATILNYDRDPSK
jgi:hypothetical protein